MELRHCWAVLLRFNFVLKLARHLLLINLRGWSRKFGSSDRPLKLSLKWKQSLQFLTDTEIVLVSFAGMSEVGLEPRKNPADLSGAAGPRNFSNGADPTKAHRRFEISGHALLKIAQDARVRLAGAGDDRDALATAWRSLKLSAPATE